MGRVFLGQDVLLERLVAIKFIAAGEPDSEHRIRFLQEGRAVARLSHPNVVAIHRVGEVVGHQYLVSEFVRGRGLETVPKPLPLDEFLPIAIGLARGLAAAHRKGILHRDIKPSNAVLSDSGEIKLLDFGLASLGQNADERSQEGDLIPPTATLGERTDLEARSHAVFGTPRYMAPELLDGAHASRRSDIYSLGAVFYELCSGTSPHSTAGTRAASLNSHAPRGNPRLAAVVDRCLSSDPSARFSSADELVDALEQLLPTRRGGIRGTENPYRGLRPFEAEHSDVFFGRESETRALLERLRSEPRVVVAGDSGVGKSSLCRAGVLVRLEEGVLEDGRTWRVLRIFPGKNPVTALAQAFASVLEIEEEALTAWISSEPAALARALQRVRARKTDFGLCLFVDQAEELFTLSDPATAAQAGEALSALESASAFRLLVAVRGDFVTRLAMLPGFGDELSTSLFFVRPLSPEKLREVVVGPARTRGWSFESEEMIQLLVEPIRGAPGGLPLLQFALAELWEVRDTERKLLSKAALDAIGGVTGALAQHADGVIASLTSEQQNAARRLLVGLLTSERTRARKTSGELQAHEGTAQLALNTLIRERLVVVSRADGESVLELAHESLADGWIRLRDWLDTASEQKRSVERLERAAAEWARLGHRNDVLWRGRQLLEATYLPASLLGPQESKFLAASNAATRRTRWTKRAVIVFVPLLLLSAVALGQLHSRRELRAQASTRFAAGAQANAKGTERAANAERQASLAYDAFDQYDPDQKDAQNPETVWAVARDAARAADEELSRAEHEFEAARLLRPDSTEILEQLRSVLGKRIRLAREFHWVALNSELYGRLSWLEGPTPTREFAVTFHLVPPDRDRTGVLERYVDHGGRLRLESVWPNDQPLRPLRLAQGSYRLRLKGSLNADFYYPFLVESSDLTVDVSLPNTQQIPNNFAYIPNGQFFFGSDDPDEIRSSLAAAPQHRLTQGAFLISKDEVTFSDWIDFLKTLSRGDRERMSPNLSGQVGSMRLTEEKGTWRLRFQPGGSMLDALFGRPFEYPGRTKTRFGESVHRLVQWARVPVSGIDQDSEMAYLAWLDESRRVPGARLCTEREWERAARGADRRVYTTGSILDPAQANFASTYANEPDTIGPDEVGTHPESDSPFGIHDLEGNGMERVQLDASRTGTIAKSAAWYLDIPLDGRIAGRSALQRTTVAPSLGFRVCTSWRDPN